MGEGLQQSERKFGETGGVDVLDGEREIVCLVNGSLKVALTEWGEENGYKCRMNLLPTTN